MKKLFFPKRSSSGQTQTTDNIEWPKFDITDVPFGGSASAEQAGRTKPVGKQRSERHAGTPGQNVPEKKDTSANAPQGRPATNRSAWKQGWDQIKARKPKDPDDRMGGCMTYTLDPNDVVRVTVKQYWLLNPNEPKRPASAPPAFPRDPFYGRIPEEPTSVEVTPLMTSAEFLAYSRQAKSWTLCGDKYVIYDGQRQYARLCTGKTPPIPPDEIDQVHSGTLYAKVGNVFFHVCRFYNNEDGTFHMDMYYPSKHYPLSAHDLDPAVARWDPCEGLLRFDVTPKDCCFIAVTNHYRLTKPTT